MLDAVRRFVPEGVVCDVGARYGVLVHLAREQGLEAFGIELNREAVAFVLDDVLEHLVDPAGDLNVMSTLQQPGDHVFLRQMDLDSLGHRLFRRNWFYIQPAAHMNYFRESTLRRLLDGVRYELVEVVRAGRLRNTAETAGLIVGDLLRSLTRRKRPDWRVGGRRMYLTERGKSIDDMFLAIARKR